MTLLNVLFAFDMKNSSCMLASLVMYTLFPLSVEASETLADECNVSLRMVS